MIDSKRKPPKTFEPNSCQNKISRRNRSSRIRSIAIFGLTFFGFGKVERSIDFTATSIENNIVSNYIAAIEEIDEHEVILYSSADEAIEKLEADAYHSSEHTVKTEPN